MDLATIPWITYSGSLSMAPGTYQIRFAETDNVLFFQQGVDNASINLGAVPEPSTWAMMILAFAGMASWSIAALAKARWLLPQPDQTHIANSETAFGRSFCLASRRPYRLKKKEGGSLSGCDRRIISNVV